MIIKIDKINAIAIALAIISMVVAIFAFTLFRSDNILLQKIKLVPPGIQLQSVTNQLGRIMYEFTDIEAIFQRGSIKDKRFCKDKKLYWFDLNLLPVQVLEVYTDTNDVIVYVTWQGL